MGIPYLQALLSREPVFTHFDEHTGKQTTYAPVPMIAAIERGELKAEKIIANVDPEFALWMKTARGVEAHRVLPLMAVPFEELDPVLFCQQADGTALLVDGTHRYVAMAARGEDGIRAYMVAYGDWEPYLVDGMPGIADPDAFIAKPSGL